MALSFRDTIEKGGRFTPEAGRYHLYVSYACPWAHRTLITRVLKGLTGIIGLSVVHWHMDGKGWRFATPEELSENKGDFFGTQDHLYNLDRIRELYFKADPNYGGRFTVPVLWDKKEETIVNNESLEIIRIFNTAFNDLIDDKYKKIDLYPTDLQKEIDELNGWIYDNINNGVYKAGFSTAQEVYDKECANVFKHLDRVEAIFNERHANGQKYLTGNTLTEADVRLFTTIIRFDPVYVQHFKCNIGMIRYQYPHIHQWVRELYWGNPAFNETTHFDHIKLHYTKLHPAINPHGITPLGPVPNILKLDDA